MKPILNNLNAALTYQLEGLYDAEKRLQRYIPDSFGGATSRGLKAEIKNYLESAADKRTKLKRMFSYVLTGPFGRKNRVVDEMLKDARDFSKFASTPDLKDTILIASLRQINQYKISAYRSAITFAIELDLDPVTELLDEILAWEEDTAKSLSRVALYSVSRNTSSKSLV